MAADFSSRIDRNSNDEVPKRDDVTTLRSDIHKEDSADGISHTMRKSADVNLQKIRDRANKLRVDLLEGFEKQLQDLVEDFVQEIEKIEQSPTCNGTAHGARRKAGELFEKEFIERRSILSELLEISHVRTIYHIFVAILIVFMLNTLVYDFMEHGRIVLDFQMIVWTFGKFPIVISVWMCMIFSTSLVVYTVFQYWAYNRRPGRAYWLDYVWLSAYIVYQLVFLLLPLHAIAQYSLPSASTVVVLAEQTRMMMKAHAFIRENIPRAMAHKKTTAEPSNGEELPCPDFSKYLYFLFAPTLVYRDSYPRNKGPVRWNYVVSNFIQVLASLFYIYYIFERFCIPVFRNFNSDFVTPHHIIVCIFSCMLPGTLLLFIGFFCILHSWLNAFAEMLRFGDRLFYKDWWNSSSFSNYYRTWNVVVHDWLYSYVYREIYMLCGKRNRALPMASVFLLSAVFHEYILTFAFGFFYPVLFVMFAGAGFAFIFLPNKSDRTGNIFMWVALFIGNGVLMCLYSMEWYARRTCPNEDHESWFAELVPRSWACGYSAASNTLIDIAALHSEL